MIILIIYFTGVGLENTWATNLDMFFSVKMIYTFH